MSQTLASKKSPTPKKDIKPTRKDSNRDLVEQLVVALILACLIRGFEAEAFVIPTGSMAPTLMGKHKEVECPECGKTYPVNAAGEVEGSKMRVLAGTCPNCHYQAKIDEAPSFKGDRILVMKFLYSLPFLPGGGGPNRWDVVVFKYPEEPEVNYIKRLVGLPNEELRVYFGDILTRPLGSNEPFRFERRPLEHQSAMQMLVWDDAYRPKAMEGMPEWARWRSRSEGAWTEQKPGTYVAAGKGSDWADLRYSHRVPDPRQWEEILRGETATTPARPTLIGDFYSYNSGVSGSRYGEWSDNSPPHWVGDLTLSCRLEPTTPSGILRLELVEGGVSNRCEIDVATGMATLYHGDTALVEPVSCGIKGVGSHDVAFANVDDRLTLWVDGRTPFGAGVAYADGSATHPAPTAADLDPVGIGVKGGAARVSGLVLKRDIYYTLNPGRSDYTGQLTWPLSDSADPARRAAAIFDLMADPGRFAELGGLDSRDFTIRPGHYMMMGDNSPCSKDSRGWEQRDQMRPERPDMGWDPNLRESWEVPESLLIGKAFYVYWPHGKPFGPDIRLGADLRIPFRPYFERMKWIR